MALLYSVAAFFIFAITKIPQPGKCFTKEVIFRAKKKEYLANHVIETKKSGSELECSRHCVSKESCESVNYRTSGVGKGLCELNSKPSQREISERLRKPEFNHLFIVQKVKG